MGGGNGGGLPEPPPVRGLSPRGRGKRRQSTMKQIIVRSIPAWAGETGAVMLSDWTRWVYPRVGGGNEPPPGTEPPPGGLSPRGRGKRRAGG